MNIYFAHPAFTPEQKAFREYILELFKKTKISSNIRILDPFEFSPAIEGDREKKKLMAGAVAQSNIALLDQTQLVIAVIDDRDLGVAWEMGFANARGIPTITVSSKDYDVNLMLSNTVVAHIPSLRDNETSFLSILEAHYKCRYLP